MNGILSALRGALAFSCPEEGYGMLDELENNEKVEREQPMD